MSHISFWSFFFQTFLIFFACVCYVYCFCRIHRCRPHSLFCTSLVLFSYLLAYLSWRLKLIICAIPCLYPLLYFPFLILFIVNNFSQILNVFIHSESVSFYYYTASAIISAFPVYCRIHFPFGSHLFLFPSFLLLPQARVQFFLIFLSFLSLLPDCRRKLLLLMLNCPNGIQQYVK